MTVSQIKAFLSKEDKENKKLIRLLNTIEKHEKNFKDLCPIMGLERYCYLYKVPFQSFNKGNINLQYAVIKVEDNRQYIAVKPLLANGKTVGKPILTDLYPSEFYRRIGKKKV